MLNLLSSRRLNLPVLTLLALWAAEPGVHAYIDPGSGALIWQAIVAGFVGAAFYFRRFFNRFVSRDRREEPPTDSGR